MEARLWGIGFGILTPTQYSFLYRQTQELNRIFEFMFRYRILQEVHGKKRTLTKYIHPLVFGL